MTDTPASSHSSSDVEAADARDLEARLAAEREGTAYWRGVAHQRRVESARVQRRPLVRAAIAVDRRTAPLQDAVRSGLSRIADSRRRASVKAGAMLRRRELGARQGLIDSLVGEPRDAPAPHDPRSVVVVHLGPRPANIAGIDVTIVTAEAGDVDAVVAAARADLVCILGPWAAPLTTDWLDRLAEPLHDDVVATVPQVVHGRRPAGAATAHDLLVQSVGYGVEIAPDGSPLTVALHAGEVPDPSRSPEPVVGGGSSALLVDRDRWVAVGGMGSIADPGDPATVDAAFLGLSLRLAEQGGSTLTAPKSLVSDNRPVSAPARLTSPLPAEHPAWVSLVEGHGPRVARIRVGDTPPTQVVITTATPSPKVAPRSGDWHFARRLAAAFERAGRRTTVQTIDRADSTAGRVAGIHVVLRGLEPVHRTAGQRHVLWVISHPEALQASECDAADLVVVASRRYAEHLRTITDTPVEVLLQATDPTHFRPMPPVAAHSHPVTVVANTRGFERRAVSDALLAGLAPAIYGMGWDEGPAAEMVAADYVDFDALPAVYCSAGVVLNDHWDTMRRWGFVSNRIFDVAACGTPVISDHLPEIGELFGDLVPTWQTPEDLGAAVAAVAADPEGARLRAAALRELVTAGHTFDHRVAELEQLLSAHGLTSDLGR